MKKNTHHLLEGAEAVLTHTTFGPMKALDKKRAQKPYRPASLDEKIRSSRTRVEARLLARAKEAGVPCPVVLAVGPFDIVMSEMKGKTLNRYSGTEVPVTIWKLAGTYLARLHKAGIVHGDYTPANLMWDGKRAESLVVIDFGLGSVTIDMEDHAIDVLTMKKALSGEKARAAFLSGYGKEGDKRVLKSMAEVEQRARYAERGAG